MSPATKAAYPVMIDDEEEILNWDYALETVPSLSSKPVEATVTKIPPRAPLAD